MKWQLHSITNRQLLRWDKSCHQIWTKFFSWHLLTKRETSLLGLGPVTEQRNQWPNVIFCLQSNNGGSGRTPIALWALLVMPRHNVKVSPQQLVELLCSECIGDKHSVYLQHILACNRSDYFLLVIQERKKSAGELVRRISKLVVLLKWTCHMLPKMLLVFSWAIPGSGLPKDGNTKTNIRHLHTSSPKRNKKIALPKKLI